MSYNCDDCEVALDCDIVGKAPCQKSFVNERKALQAENKQQADFLSLAKEQMDAYQAENAKLTEKIEVLELAADLTTYTKDQLTENKLLQEALGEWRNNEGSVCPEDVGFVEYIKSLENKIKGLREELKEMAKPCSGDVELVKNALDFTGCDLAELQDKLTEAIAMVLKRDKQIAQLQAQIGE